MTSEDTSYVARNVNRPKRKRATKAEMAARLDAIQDIVTASAPTSIRFTLYKAVSLGLPDITKDDSGYNKVQRAVLELRRAGRVPYSAIVDTTRWMRKPESWDDVDTFLSDVGASYRRNLWRDTHVAVEVWAESESIAGVVHPVTAKWDVPLYPTKGQSSDTFVWGAAEQYRHESRPIHIYYLGDRDPAGMEIESTLKKKLLEMSGRDDITVTRLACTEEQVREFDLLGGTPKKPTWKNALTEQAEPFDGLAVEVEALETEYLRDLVERAITKHIEPHWLAVHHEVEAQERAGLEALINGGVW